MPEIIFSNDKVRKYFPISGGILGRTIANVHAVEDVSIDIYKGECLGLVGESGCGKSTLGRCILNLTELTAGTIYYFGKDISKMSKEEKKDFRKETSIIFQDPFLSLHPRMTVGEIMAEPLVVHKIGDKKEREQKVVEWCKMVGLDPYHLYRYPYQFSGGQKQRIGLARAMIMNPKFIVADEPVAALDVSVKASIINLMKKLQEQFNITFLFVSHDLAVVRQISDRVAVMYLGKLVEIANVPEIFDNPIHPYTKALLSAVPIPDTKVRMDRIILKGDVEAPINPPKGCRFCNRCLYAREYCEKQEPLMVDIGNNHFVACHDY
jgi:oligopeptide/dipeptide ABC transporter ATP-binding protein